MTFSNYKKIIVHCGIHKTGSSYLQQVFRQNAAVLARHGIHYPTGHNEEVSRSGNHSLIATTYREGSDVTAHFQKYITLASSAGWLLLSGEEFARVAEEGDFLARLVRAADGADLQFIFYFRRHDHLRESVYAESVKQSLYGDIYGTKFNFDFHKTVGPFVSAVGINRVKVRSYNKDVWPGGELIRDFLDAMERPEIWAELVLPEGPRINSSLSRQQTFLLSRLTTEKGKRRLLSFFREQPLPSNGDLSKYFMSPQERRDFRALHAASSEAMGKLFGISDMNDFLGVDDRGTNEEWAPFSPDWKLLALYLAAFADWDGQE